MRCVTWTRDSHGLFDYESKFINKRSLKTISTGKIIRVNNDVDFVSPKVDSEELPEDS